MRGFIKEKKTPCEKFILKKSYLSEPSHPEGDLRPGHTDTAVRNMSQLHELK